MRMAKRQADATADLTLRTWWGRPGNYRQYTLSTR